MATGKPSRWSLANFLASKRARRAQSQRSACGSALTSIASRCLYARKTIRCRPPFADGNGPKYSARWSPGIIKSFDQWRQIISCPLCSIGIESSLKSSHFVVCLTADFLRAGKGFWSELFLIVVLRATKMHYDKLSLKRNLTENEKLILIPEW